MGSVLALSWEAADESHARRIVRAASLAGFVPVSSLARGWIGVRGPRRPRLHDVRGGLILLGDVFVAPDGGALATGGRLPRLRSVVGSFWGRYIALDRDGDGMLRAALRDPSGAIEASSWRCRTVRVVSTDTPDWLMNAVPAPIAIDWSGVPALITDPLAGLAQPPLIGLSVLNAGEMMDFDTDRREQVWAPTTGDDAEVWDPDVARSGLRDRVEVCVQALAGEVAVLGSEVSGGLDSAIVASALGRHRARTALWLNAWSTRSETDERHYARAVADRLGLELAVLQRVEQALEAETLHATAGGVRPGYNGADPVFDALVAEACRTAGVEGLFTGKGGDALFYQGASPAIFADLVKGGGLSALLSPKLAGIARWTRRSTWSLIRNAVSPPAPERESEPGDGWVRGRAFPTPHPWLAGAEGVAPAKRLQVQALASNLAYATACRRTEVVDLIHPLMSQPLVEWSMRIPTPVLTGGIVDRFLARSAFADQLPAEVVWRRSKGDYTATFEREAAASLPFLRSHLLDGLLVRHDVIDRSRTEALLDRDRLMWAGGGLHLTTAALVESWLRVWSGRSAAS